MPGSPRPLLCELHAHSMFSDGALTVRELVDLYGFAGFDVLAVTDHVCRDEHARRGSVRASAYDGYLACVEAEAERARQVYGLLVIPGLELTYDDPRPDRAGHAVAIGLRRWTGVDDGLEAAVAAADLAGAALIGAHPYTLAATATSHRTTAAFAENREWAREALHRFELCNRHEFFTWVAEERLPAVANGDFHRPEHLATWKTMLPCEHEEEAVVDYLRSRREAGLVRFDPALTAARLAAA